MSSGKLSVPVLVSGLFAAALLIVPASAQTQAQISRPLDGSTVREAVNILVPISTVPPAGFVAYTIDGRFRTAAATKTNDGSYFVYSWDTKALDPDESLSMDKRKPFDGRHTIAVQACDASGRKVGNVQQISVFVKNYASASDLPAGGVKLRYKTKLGASNRYKFTAAVDIKDVQGSSDMAAAAGEAIEGMQLAVQRTIEDSMSGNIVLVRQRAYGPLRLYQNGRLVPADTLLKSTYQTEDSMGHVQSTIESISPGTAVSIDLPNLPSKPIRIGDTWSQKENIFHNAITGKTAKLLTTNVLEALEWEGGYPCAKIRTSFSGKITIPFSKTFSKPVSIQGETVTYFAYGVGKLISSKTTAEARMSVDQSVINSLTQGLMSSAGAAGAATSPTYPGMSGPMPMPGSGPMRSGPMPVSSGPSFPGMGTQGSPDTISAASQTVDVTLVIRQNIELPN
jgi:hypothetical protein